MTEKMTERQLKARKLRLSGFKMREIGEKLGISKQGARYLLVASDKYSSIKISKLQQWKKAIKNARK